MPHAVSTTRSYLAFPTSTPTYSSHNECAQVGVLQIHRSQGALWIYRSCHNMQITILEATNLHKHWNQDRYSSRGLTYALNLPGKWKKNKIKKIDICILISGTEEVLFIRTWPRYTKSIDIGVTIGNLFPERKEDQWEIRGMFQYSFSKQAGISFTRVWILNLGSEGP